MNNKEGWMGLHFKNENRPLENGLNVTNDQFIDSSWKIRCRRSTCWHQLRLEVDVVLKQVDAVDPIVK